MREDAGLGSTTWTGWLRRLLLPAFLLLFLLAAHAVEAKDILTFQRIVIVEGGSIAEPVEITDEADLVNTFLDIQPGVPPKDDLGTAHQLILYPDGSDVTMKVTYYASLSGERGYIHREKPVSIGNGTLGPGWARPSQELESTLRNYGVVNLATQAGGLDVKLWQAIAIPLGVATFALVALAVAWILRSKRRSAKAV